MCIGELDVDDVDGKPKSKDTPPNFSVGQCIRPETKGYHFSLTLGVGLMLGVGCVHMRPLGGGWGALLTRGCTG